MPSSRTLRLHRDTLADLASDELVSIAGASHLGCDTHQTCVVVRTIEGCVSRAALTCTAWTRIVPCVSDVDVSRIHC